MKDVTIREVASAAGVSTATVSRYINNSSNVSKEIGLRIEKAISDLDYVPNSVAISLKKTQTRSIGIVVPDLANVSFMDTVKGISDVAAANGFQPILMNNSENSDNENKILDVLISKRVDGIVLASAGGNEEKILKINNSRIPIVLMDRDVCNSTDNIIIDAVVNDNFNGSYKMVNYLISLGHRNIAILTSRMNLVVGKERLEGYIKALEDNNIEVNDDYIFYGNFSFDSGYQLAMDAVMQPLRPTAIFSVNNLMALGVVAALNKMNISIPKNISVCAFGDFKYYNILNPALTVVNQMAYKIGEQAAILLVDKMRHYNNDEKWKPKKIILPGNIIMRDSCSSPSLY